MSVAILRHLVSGDAFFTGVGCLLLAVIWRHFRLFGRERVVVALMLIGGALVVVSATPLPDAVNVGLVVASFIWLLFSKRPPPQNSEAEAPSPTASRRVFNRLLIGDLLLALVWLPTLLTVFSWRLVPVVQAHDQPRLIVLADSITAGIGEGKVTTWPKLLEREHNIDVIDHSRMGATIASATQRLDNIKLPAGLLLIELGGNDVLGTTSPRKFEQDLDRLLKEVTNDKRPVLMFELPLPPLGNRFGQAQRCLAQKYSVPLIPKRILAGILLSPKTTVDSIHLNQTGQDQMAKTVWQIIEPVLK